MINKKSLGKHFSLIHRYKHILVKNQFEDCGFGTGQYMFLLRISENEGLSQKELSQLLHIDKGTTTKAVKKLEEGGFVTTQCCCHDKRQHELYLTDSGRAILPKLREITDNFYEILCKGLSEEEMACFHNTLLTMEKNLCNAVGRLKKENCCHDKK